MQPVAFPAVLVACCWAGVGALAAQQQLVDPDTDVENGAEQLQGYEIVVQRAHRKDVELTIAPDGRILEGPGKQN